MDCLAQAFTIKWIVMKMVIKIVHGHCMESKGLKKFENQAFNIQSKNAIQTLINKFQELCKSIILSKKACDIFILIANIKLLKRKSYFV
jgi:hypothetical protein